MSFDLFLQRFRHGEPASADRSAILSLLRRHCSDKPDDFGFYVIEFSDGTGAEFSAKELEAEGEFTGCAFYLRTVSAQIISFVHAVAAAGDMVVINPQGEDSKVSPSVILCAKSQEQHLPDGIGSVPVVAESPAALGRLLDCGMERWEEYRDLVIHSGSKNEKMPT